MASAVVIAPRVEQRKKLESLFQQLPRLGAFNSADLLSEARILIQKSAVPDYVFLSDELEREEKEKFISWVKQKREGSKTVFITVCSADSSNSEALADHLASGSHAVLREPISLQALQDVLSVARGVKLQGTQTRLKNAAALFLTSALDKISTEQGLKVEPKPLQAKVKEAMKDFKQLTGVSLTLEAIRPKDNGDGSGARLEKYKGVSKRVREIYEQRIAALVSKVFDRTKNNS